MLCPHCRYELPPNCGEACPLCGQSLRVRLSRTEYHPPTARTAEADATESQAAPESASSFKPFAFLGLIACGVVIGALGMRLTPSPRQEDAAPAVVADSDDSADKLRIEVARLKQDLKKAID